MDCGDATTETTTSSITRCHQLQFTYGGQFHRAQRQHRLCGQLRAAVNDARRVLDSAPATTAAAGTISVRRRARPLRRFAPWWRQRDLNGEHCRLRLSIPVTSAAPLSPPVTENPDSAAITGSSLAMVTRTLVAGEQLRAHRRPARARPVLDHRVPTRRHEGVTVGHTRKPSAPGRLAAYRQVPHRPGARRITWGRIRAATRSPGVLPPRWLVGEAVWLVRRWTWTTA